MVSKQVVIESKKVSAHQSKSFEQKIEYLHDLVNVTKKQINFKYGLSANAILTEERQDEVILELSTKINEEFVDNMRLDVLNWVAAKEGVVSQYLRDRSNFIGQELKAKGIKYKKKNLVTVVAKCNSEGGDTVLYEDIEQWVSELNKIVTESKLKNHLNQADVKFLTSKATRNQIVSSIYKMTEFPITIKETEVNNFLNEEAIQKSLKDLLAPSAALKYEGNISDIIISTSNSVEFISPTGELIHRVDGRVKLSEPEKWVKYFVGLRKDPHYDGGGVKEVIPNVRYLISVAKEIVENHAMQGKGKSEIDHRYRGISGKVKNESEKQNKKYAKKHNPCAVQQLNSKDLVQAYVVAVEGLVLLLKSPYDLENGDLRGISELTDKLVCGEWIDMKEKTTKSPLEIQVKDLLFELIYGPYSPLGHNSKEYNYRRTTKVQQDLIKSGNDKIYAFLLNKVMRPAFDIDYLYGKAS